MTIHVLGSEWCKETREKHHLQVLQRKIIFLSTYSTAEGQTKSYAGQTGLDVFETSSVICMDVMHDTSRVSIVGQKTNYI